MTVNANLIHQRQFRDFPQFIAVPVFVVPQYAPVQPSPQPEGLSLGTLLAGLTTFVSGAVLFDPKASKEAKAVAKMALGASVPFLLNKAFEQQAWPHWN